MAQVGNLLFRRPVRHGLGGGGLVIGRAEGGVGGANGLRIANPRYSRLPVGATALVIVTANFLFSIRAPAQGEPNEIPKLHPFHDEIPPTFWEQHGTLMLVAGLLLIAVAGMVLRRLTRPRPPVVPPPAVEARAALAAVPATAGEGTTLSRVSQILRLYVRRTFELPPAELTTAELCQALSTSPHVGPELAGALTNFLRDNDRQKFSPTSSAPPAAQAIAGARALIDQCEARQASLIAARMATSVPAHQPA